MQNHFSNYMPFEKLMTTLNDCINKLVRAYPLSSESLYHVKNMCLTDLLLTPHVTSIFFTRSKTILYYAEAVALTECAPHKWGIHFSYHFETEI